MPPPYIEPHWERFADIAYQPQGPVGVPPSVWRQAHRLEDVPGVDHLPGFTLDRHAVRTICQDPNKHVLFGYVCVMAWGGQELQYGGARRVRTAWGARDQIATRLTALRAGGTTRGAAYELFCGGEHIEQLGPSFFTKLLYFFSPVPSFYIMDQWTSRSVNLLVGREVVRLDQGGPHWSNRGGNYQAFCEEIDLMAGLLACLGAQVEERLFSHGKPHPWPWRRYVEDQYRNHPPAKQSRYQPSRMHAIYPHIPVEAF
jgi:hypothetical protein